MICCQEKYSAKDQGGGETAAAAVENKKPENGSMRRKGKNVLSLGNEE